MGYDLSRKDEEKSGGSEELMKLMRIHIVSFLIIFLLFGCNSENKKTAKLKSESDTLSTSSNSNSIKYVESNSKYEISGYVDNGSFKLPNVKISLFSNWRLDTAIFTNDTGYFSFHPLPINKDYSIYFSKPGFITKFCILNKFEDKDLDRPGFFPLQISTSLFSNEFYDLKKLAELKSIPAAISNYSKTIDNVVWDLSSIEDYKLKLESARRKSN
jgi:hypothetical protein